MEPLDPLLLVVEPLQRAGISYLITGSVATIHYGEPRYTNAVDLIISMAAGRALELPEISPEPDFYCPPVETIREELCANSDSKTNGAS